MKNGKVPKIVFKEMILNFAIFNSHSIYGEADR